VKPYVCPVSSRRTKSCSPAHPISKLAAPASETGSRWIDCCTNRAECPQHTFGTHALMFVDSLCNSAVLGHTSLQANDGISTRTSVLGISINAMNALDVFTSTDIYLLIYLLLVERLTFHGFTSHTTNAVPASIASTHCTRHKSARCKNSLSATDNDNASCWLGTDKKHIRHRQYRTVYPLLTPPATHVPVSLTSRVNGHTLLTAVHASSGRLIP